MLISEILFFTPENKSFFSPKVCDVRLPLLPFLPPYISFF